MACPVPARAQFPQSVSSRGFSLLELLVATAVMAVILIAVASLLSMASSTYQRTSGRLDSFEAARAAFDVMSRTLRQATLQSYVGYDDPKRPQNYQLKSDLHFVSGRQQDLELKDTGLENSHAVFFQAPLGTTESAALRRANMVLASTGFFIAYGNDPLRPGVLGDRVETRPRYRLFQFIEPRENMRVYENTIAMSGDIPVSNAGYQGYDWFKDAVNAERFIHPLAENIVALSIQPVFEGDPVTDLHWNSRDTSNRDTHHRLPQALNVVMVAVDESSAARLGDDVGAFLPDAPRNLEQHVEQLEEELQKRNLNYRKFQTLIPLDAGNTRL